MRRSFQKRCYTPCLYASRHEKGGSCKGLKVMNDGKPTLCSPREAMGRVSAVRGILAGTALLFATLSFAVWRDARAASAPAPKQHADLLISGGTIVTMDANRTLLDDGAIAVSGDSIVGVGPRAEMEARFNATERVDARGQIVLPGLINGHTHAAMTLFRGLADDLALKDWLEKYIFPAEAKNVSAEFVRWGTKLAMLEMIRGGITTYADIYYFENDVADVTRQAGMRGVLGEAILDFPTPDSKTTADALRYTEMFLQKWQGDSLVTPAVAPHSIYTVSDQAVRESVALARKYHAPILTHLAEAAFESEYSREKHGMSPIAYAAQLGLLGGDVTLAHCVWADAQDIALLAKTGTGCVHNPSSNMKLASGVMPVEEMLAAGVPVGLGTDSAASNDDLDLMLEMNLAAKLQKVWKKDPRALPAKQVVEMATIEGARALHKEKQIGSLEAGKKADIIMLKVDAPHATPLYDVYTHLVYALKASDVQTMVIGGKIVMRDRRMLTLNEGEILAHARNYSRAIRASVAPARTARH